jgi:hypothetical protein
MKVIGIQKNGGHKRLDERHFRRIDKFSGDEKSWTEGCFQMKAAVRSADKQAAASNAGDVQDRSTDDGIDFDGKLDALAAQMMTCSAR